MKQVKFRSWNPTLKRMSYGADLKHIGFQWNYKRESWQVLNMVDGVDIEEDLSEFTGLTDLNGTDIYEGDIVKWDDCSNGQYWRLAEVKMAPDLYFDCAGIFDVDGIKNSSKSQFHFGNFIYQDTDKHLTVIGNIYQPPVSLGWVVAFRAINSEKVDCTNMYPTKEELLDGMKKLTELVMMSEPVQIFAKP